MNELTKALNNGCYYLTLKWGESLYLNSCVVYSVEPMTTKQGNKALLVTTERGRHLAIMDEDYYAITNPTAADIYNHCSQVKDWDCY